MIIECIKCFKKFEVDSDLIPNKGRTIQCGSCNHVWFYNKNDEFIEYKLDESNKNTVELEEKNQTSTQIKEINTVKNDARNIKKENKEFKNKKNNFKFSKALSYITVLIISFLAIIIILDTFKSPLYVIFPNLESLLFNLFETVKDISLFMKDLI